MVDDEPPAKAHQAVGAYQQTVCALGSAGTRRLAVSGARSPRVHHAARRRGGGMAARGARAAGGAGEAHRRAHEHNCGWSGTAVRRRGIPASSPFRLGRATYLIGANPLLTYAQKPRTETEEKRGPASAPKKRLDNFNT